MFEGSSPKSFNVEGELCMYCFNFQVKAARGHSVYF